MSEMQPVSAENVTNQYEEGRLVDPDPSAVIPWTEALRRLAEAEGFWLATLRRDGRPHLRPVLAVWADNRLHISTGPAAGKARNLSRDGRVAVTTRTEDMDLVVEGDAARVTDRDDLRVVGDAYRSKYGWPVTVRDAAFHAPYGAPSAGPPPYHLYRITPSVVYGFGTNEIYAPRSTRWQF